MMTRGVEYPVERSARYGSIRLRVREDCDCTRAGQGHNTQACTSHIIISRCVVEGEEAGSADCGARQLDFYDVMLKCGVVAAEKRLIERELVVEGLVCKDELPCGQKARV